MSYLVDARKLLTARDVEQLEMIGRHTVYSEMQTVCDCGFLESECRCSPPQPASWWRRLLKRKGGS